MSKRASQSFSDREVNVLAAMLEAAHTGAFHNPERTEDFQSVARKVGKLKAAVSK